MTDDRVITLLQAIRGDLALLRSKLDDLALRAGRIEILLIELHDAMQRLQKPEG